MDHNIGQYHIQDTDDDRRVFSLSLTSKDLPSINTKALLANGLGHSRIDPVHGLDSPWVEPDRIAVLGAGEYRIPTLIDGHLCGAYTYIKEKEMMIHNTIRKGMCT